MREDAKMRFFLQEEKTRKRVGEKKCNEKGEEEEEGCQ